MDADPFDIFEFLGISRREDALHTPMIASLLDPSGPHGFAGLFLESFLELLSAGDSQLQIEDASNYHWMLKQEQRVPGGRVDILLLCPEKKLAIAIENKIDANESKTQLACYSQWLKSLSPYFTTSRLLFLTLRGKTPQRVTADECTLISYRQILQCLVRCLNEVPSVPAESVIRTYAKLLGNLVGDDQPICIKVGEPSKESFNVYRLLRMSRREAVLHTRMLAGLLNPRAPHNQGSIFLCSFLRLLLDRNVVQDCINCEWKVRAEHKMEFGRLDIVLDCEEKGLLIVIENKIDSVEGENQLDRYSQWMGSRRTDYPGQTLVFLTLDGSAPNGAQTSNCRQVSYSDIRNVISECASKLGPSSFNSALEAYLTVLEGLVPQFGTSSVVEGRRLIPHMNHGGAVLDFFQDSTTQWNEFFAKQQGPSVPKHLVAVLKRDDRLQGKYHGIEIWHESLLPFQNQKGLILRIETTLGNRRMMGLYIGLHWRNIGTTDGDWLLQRQDVADLLSLGEKFYKVSEPLKKGGWFAVVERLEYTRTDGGLISIMRHHRSELQGIVASRICSIWTLVGDRVLALNRSLAARLH